jgi:hypothetical protein
MCCNATQLFVLVAAADHVPSQQQQQQEQATAARNPEVAL